MTGEKQLVKKDTRLLLFQALERASFEGSFIQKMKKDCAAMSFEFAKKYYEFEYEENLKQASYCVLGIINFGLTIISENKLENAAIDVGAFSPKQLFRTGWQEIARLSSIIHKLPNADHKYGKTLFDIEKYLAGSISAQPQLEWIGFSEYQNMLAENNQQLERERLRDYLVDKYAAKKSANIMSRIETRHRIRTILFSLLISGRPHSPLKYKELDKLTERIAQENIAEKFNEILVLFANQIPSKYRKSYKQEIAWLLEEDKALPEFLDKMSKEGKDYVKQLFFTWFDVEEYLDKISEHRYSGVKQILKGQNPADLILDLQNITDASEKLAMIDLLAEQAYQLNPDDVIDLLVYAGNNWQEKIKWPKFSDSSFEDLMTREERSQILHDIFKQNLEQAMIDKFNSLPTRIKVEIFRENKICHDFFLKHVKILASDFMNYFEFDQSVLLISVKELEELWSYLAQNQTSVKRYFKGILLYGKRAGIKDANLQQMFFERVYAIAAMFKTDKLNKNAQAPFYCRELKSALEKVLSKKKIADLEQKLIERFKKRQPKKK